MLAKTLCICCDFQPKWRNVRKENYLNKIEWKLCRDRLICLNLYRERLTSIQKTVKNKKKKRNNVATHFQHKHKTFSEKYLEGEEGGKKGCLGTDVEGCSESQMDWEPSKIGHTCVWNVERHLRHIHMKKYACGVLSVLRATSVCEQLFSTMSYVKNTHANTKHTLLAPRRRQLTVLCKNKSDFLQRWFADTECRGSEAEVLLTGWN